MKKISYIFIASVVLLVLKTVALGTSIPEMLSLLVVSSLCGFSLWLERQDTKKYNDKFESDVKQEFAVAASEINAIKTALGAITLGQSYKTSLRGSNGQAQR